MSDILLVKPNKAIHWLRLYRLYRSAFPVCERKPFSMIRKMQKKGKTDIWYGEKNGSFVGLAATINGDNTILIDYLAVEKKHRKCGIGSEMLQMLRSEYRGKGVFLEIESTFEDCENKGERLRRKAFYLKNGMEEMNVCADLFGVRMELLGFDCQMSYTDYNAFYRDNYSPWAAEHITEAPHPKNKAEGKM